MYVNVWVMSVTCIGITYYFLKLTHILSKYLITQYWYLAGCSENSLEIKGPPGVYALTAKILAPRKQKYQYLRETISTLSVCVPNSVQSSDIRYSSWGLTSKNSKTHEWKVLLCFYTFILSPLTYGLIVSRITCCTYMLYIY